MTEAQIKSGRPKCRKLLDKYRGYNFILDDESNFTLSNTDNLLILNFVTTNQVQTLRAASA